MSSRRTLQGRGQKTSHSETRRLAYPKVQRLGPKPFEPFSTFKCIILVDTAKGLLETIVLKWTSEKSITRSSRSIPREHQVLSLHQRNMPVLLSCLFCSSLRKAFSASDLAQPSTCRCWEVVNINIFLRATGWLRTVIIQERHMSYQGKEKEKPNILASGLLNTFLLFVLLKWMCTWSLVFL